MPQQGRDPSSASSECPGPAETQEDEEWLEGLEFFLTQVPKFVHAEDLESLSKGIAEIGPWRAQELGTSLITSKHQYDLNTEQLIDSKLGKELTKLYSITILI